MNELAESVETVTNVIQACAVAATAIAATWGLNTWRNQLLGRRKVELAEEALTAFYEWEGLLAYARNGFSSSNEGRSRVRDIQEEDNIARLKDAYFVPVERLSLHEDLFANIRTLQLRFRAYFGQEAETAFQTVSEIRRDISFAAGNLLEAASEGDEIPQQEIRNWKETIWYSYDRDEIAPKVDEAVLQIEKICRPLLEN